MSREEAFEKLEQTVGIYLMSGNADDTYCKEWREILETLKQGPSCDDTISRQAYDKGFDDGLEEGLKVGACEDCISRQEALDELDNHKYSNEFCEEHNIDWSINLGMAHIVIKDLPPATPQELKKGKWIKIQSGDRDFPESIVCSRCKNENSHLDFDEWYNKPIGKIFVTSKYCPNCGAKMEE